MHLYNNPSDSCDIVCIKFHVHLLILQSDCVHQGPFAVALIVTKWVTALIRVDTSGWATAFFPNGLHHSVNCCTDGVGSVSGKTASVYTGNGILWRETAWFCLLTEEAPFLGRLQPAKVRGRECVFSSVSHHHRAYSTFWVFPLIYKQLWRSLVNIKDLAGLKR